MTADGSIDCMLQPEDQESHVASLHYAETVAALQVLSPGGNFLLKMFTFFEDSSISLLYLLSTVFESLDIFKPATSKEGNSEVYVICKGFQPVSALHSHLNSIIESNFDTTFGIFSKQSIPNSFLVQLKECCTIFMSLQIEVIERNLRAFHSCSFRLKRLRRKVVEEFYARYELKSIPADKKIISKKTANEPHMNLNPRQHSGSYVERKHRSSMCEEERYLTLQNRLQAFVMEFNFEGTINFSLTSNVNAPSYELRPQYGKRIQKLASSKFVYTPKLRLFLEIVDLIKNSSKQKTFECDFHTKNNETGVIFEIESLSYLATDVYDVYEKKIALKIVEILQNLKPSHNLVIQNLLLLSQFLSGFIFYVGHKFFRNLFFYKEGAIVLSCYQRNEKELEALRSLVTQSTTEQAIVGLVDLKMLIKHSFYVAVVQYNTSLVLQYSLNFLKFYDESR